MREPPTNICPLLAIVSMGTNSGPAVCLGKRCALACNRWNERGDQVTCSTYVCSLKVMAESLETLVDHLTGKLYGEADTMSYYRICPYCGAHLDSGERCDCQDEKTPVGATNTGEGRAEQGLMDAVSASYYTEKLGGFQDEYSARHQNRRQADGRGASGPESRGQRRPASASIQRPCV